MPADGHTDLQDARGLFRPRPPDAHKGTMGHAALIAGSHGMLGAAILAARACLRSGVGKLTCFVTPTGYPILQSAVPEAVFQVGEPALFAEALAPGRFQSVGFGPGCGTHPAHDAILRAIARSGSRAVLDADALNHIARNGPSAWQAEAPDTVITPHPGEYRRLFGEASLPQRMAVEHRLHLILKGPGTRVCSPGSDTFVNRSGNPGMATAGSGDVLTGLLTGLLARGYPTLDACRLGVFLHGLAGDIAAERLGQESLIASDIVDNLPLAFQRVADRHQIGRGI